MSCMEAHSALSAGLQATQIWEVWLVDKVSVLLFTETVTGGRNASIFLVRIKGNAKSCSWGGITPHTHKVWG